MFNKVRREATLSTRVSDQIQALIAKSHLQPGDRLPSERQLGDSLGVSRTVIREAVRGLSAKGLLQVSPGRGGTTVRLPSAASVSESMTLFLRAGKTHMDFAKLQEVRRVLEVAIAGFAAERRTDEDLHRLHQNLRAMEAIGNNREKWAQCDVAFHRALAEATHNEIFVLMMDSINEMLIEARRLAFKVLGAPSRSIRYHGAILERVAKHEVDGARQAMQNHLTEAEQTQSKALSKVSGKVSSKVLKSNQTFL
jgi:GntR family transcriptional regulator, transcriptional repressor for pyruvate dehydrogenase complex